MKNIHVLSTDKPSRLYLNTKEYIFDNEYSLSTDECQNKHIYITSDEEIKEGDWFLEKAGRQYPIQWNGIEKLNFHCKKIILTTDQDLIKDGVQAIDDEFLEWFVKNPSCGVVDVEWIDFSRSFFINIKKEEPYQPKTIKEAAEKYSKKSSASVFQENHKKDFIAGAKFQNELILDFLYSEITERRDYSASKMCEKIIEQFKNK